MLEACYEKSLFNFRFNILHYIFRVRQVHASLSCYHFLRVFYMSLGIFGSSKRPSLIFSTHIFKLHVLWLSSNVYKRDIIKPRLDGLKPKSYLYSGKKHHSLTIFLQISINENTNIYMADYFYRVQLISITKCLSLDERQILQKVHLIFTLFLSSYKMSILGYLNREDFVK